MRKELEQQLQLQPYIVCCLEESTLLIWNMPNAIFFGKDAKCHCYPFCKAKNSNCKQEFNLCSIYPKNKKKWEIIIEDMVQSIHLFNATTEKSPNH